MNRDHSSSSGERLEGFGGTVRTLRETRGIGLRKFAKMVGISPTYLSKIERDEFPPPSEEKILAIGRALEQHPDEFLALAGRVASDLPQAILRYPREMARLLRTTALLEIDEIQRLSEHASSVVQTRPPNPAALNPRMEYQGR